MILRADVERVGKKGDVLDVADGYARNFLVPHGLALKASDGAILQTVSVGGGGPTGIAFDGTYIWTANDRDDGNAVTKIRASDGVPLDTFVVGSGPSGVAFDGANIWVANSGDGTVIKLRASDGASLGTFAVGLSPAGNR